MSTHHKLSVFYYLLLDYDAVASASGGKGGLADRFAARSGVREKYQTFMPGLWFLDRQQFEVRYRSYMRPLRPLPSVTGGLPPADSLSSSPVSSRHSLRLTPVSIAGCPGKPNPPNPPTRVRR